ncbi:MAG: hypothetical protein J7647_20695 [Cyanobacteria bacterium SBLK]|nr:hypothetical protein [Cyanobacteria bacterium SBLK]
MNKKKPDSGSSVNFNVASGRDSMTVNGAYQNATTTQNFWISMSIIGTISIGTLIGTASLALYLFQNREQPKTDSSPSQPTLIDRNTENQ